MESVIRLGHRLSNRLRLKHWALLAAIADSGTLNKAAARLNVTQPTATKLLGDIEQALGLPVFTRHARGLLPTPLGQEVMAFARLEQERLGRFAEHLERMRRGGHGQLVIGAIMGAAPDVVALAVARIKEERPLLDVRIVGETSDQIGLMLERGEIELAIGRPSEPQLGRVDFLPLANETLVLVARRGHALSRRRQIEWLDLVDWPWILQAKSSPTRKLLEEAFFEHHIGVPENQVECASIFAALQLLQTTQAVALLPEAVVRDHVKAKLLTVLPFRFQKALPVFGVLTRRADPVSEPAQAFMAHVQQVVQGGATA